ncbi:MAG: GNAT family N-acetyltransferase [Lentisphaerae bacterium]|nr:GNAT family N-acetyltransferase [Lentisphaerota bacterium]
MTIKIIDYHMSYSEEVYQLFKNIYNDDIMAQKMTYKDLNMSFHISTKIAIYQKRVIGQSNIFCKKKLHYANLGYHVAPQFQRKGIGKSLCISALRDAIKQNFTHFIIQTEKENGPAVKLAKSLGFSKFEAAFIKKHTIGFVRKITI